MLTLWVNLMYCLLPLMFLSCLGGMLSMWVMKRSEARHCRDGMAQRLLQALGL